MNITYVHTIILLLARHIGTFSTDIISMFFFSFFLFCCCFVLVWWESKCDLRRQQMRKVFAACMKIVSLQLKTVLVRACSLLAVEEIGSDEKHQIKWTCQQIGSVKANRKFVWNKKKRKIWAQSAVSMTFPIEYMFCRCVWLYNNSAQCTFTLSPCVWLRINVYIVAYFSANFC